MKNENLDKWFEQQRDCWDIADPKSGHGQRFLDKLDQNKKSGKIINLNSWWKPLLVAASLTLLVFLGLWKTSPQKSKDLAAVSAEMEQTQDFFTMAIEKELFEVEQQRSPKTQKLIDDALKQLNLLEEDYTKLKKDLAKSGEDKRVIHAMITNFQARINLLTNVLDEIENFKELNNKDYENQIL